MAGLGIAQGDAISSSSAPCLDRPGAPEFDDMPLVTTARARDQWDSRTGPASLHSFLEPLTPLTPSSSGSFLNAPSPSTEDEQNDDRACQRSLCSSPDYYNHTPSGISPDPNNTVTHPDFPPFPVPQRCFLLLTSSTASLATTSTAASQSDYSSVYASAMPSLTLAAPELVAGEATATCAATSGHRPRPNSAHSSRSSGKTSDPSSSPLNHRLARARHHQHLHLHLHRQQHRQHLHHHQPTADGNDVFESSRPGKKTKKSYPKVGHKDENMAISSSGDAGMPPPLTPDEFEKLPIAIQRKYFSTLERLRFAQGSGAVDGIFHHYDSISAHNFKRRKLQRRRGASDHQAGRLSRPSLRQPHSHCRTADPLAFADLPEKIQRKEFTREEQIVLARNLRTSVILDAADEAIYKIGRRASRRHAPDFALHAPTLSCPPSMDSLRLEKRGRGRQAHPEPELEHEAEPEPVGHDSAVPQSFFDTFRWLDEDEDLDLSLFLDDYHANLREALPEPVKERRPSFRRHLSISKLPFGRPSLSSSRPATKDATTVPPSPAGSSPGNAAAPFQHVRRKSRTLSLITPKHAPKGSISAIDPAAAHYQDPEARKKLRVYLASPQKFDEAIEFGFPSTEVLSASPVITKNASLLRRHRLRQNLSDDSENLRTFLADDDDDDDEEEDDDEDERLDSDQASIPDPDSPKTPLPSERPPRPLRMATDPTHMHKPTESYAQAPASSREMTLRMTLTRPDLRACEDQIYGWQQNYQPGRKSQSPLREELTSPVAYIGDSRPKESIEQVLAGFDQEGADAADRGVMKRIWNRVRRS